jgi:hypothetical protein
VEYEAYILRCELHDLAPLGDDYLDDRYWNDGGALIEFQEPPPPQPLSDDEQQIRYQIHNYVKPPVNMLLDSWDIRRVGWTGLTTEHDVQPYRFALPASASNSEALTPELEDMSSDALQDESFLYNKNPEEALLALPGGVLGRNMVVKARVAEAEVIRLEQVAKAGDSPISDYTIDRYQNGYDDGYRDGYDSAYTCLTNQDNDHAYDDNSYDHDTDDQYIDEDNYENNEYDQGADDRGYGNGTDDDGEQADHVNAELADSDAEYGLSGVDDYLDQSCARDQAFKQDLQGVEETRPGQSQF